MKRKLTVIFDIEVDIENETMQADVIFSFPNKPSTEEITKGMKRFMLNGVAMACQEMMANGTFDEK